MKKIAVTGGAGFIGSHLVERLAAGGHEIVVIDNFNDFYNPLLKRRNAERLETTGRVRISETDLCDRSGLLEVFKEHRFDQVVHLAAYAGVTPSIERPLLYEEVNVRGTLELLELCRGQGIQNFTFASSSSVYGGNEKIPFGESDPVNRPICPYAATKRAGELLCSTYTHLYGMNIPCLRFFTVYGPRQRPEMAIVKFIRHVDQGREIVLYNEGRYSRDYTYIEDIVHGILAAMDRRAGYELFNLGGSRTTSTIDLVRLIERQLGKQTQVLLQPGRAGEVETTFADVALARQELGYEPKVPLEEGIARTVDWYRGLGFTWE